MGSSANDTFARHAAMPFSDAPIGTFPPTPAQRALIEASRRIGFGNGGLRKRGSAALLNLRPSPIDYDYFGLTLRFYPALCGSMRHMLMSPGWSERREIAFLLEHTPPDGVFVDVGVNVGFYLFHLAAKRRNATILGFEPAAKYHDLLTFNTEQNRLANVHVINAALSDRTGTATFNLDGESLMHGEGAVDVKTISLAEALAARHIQRVDALKIDIEGAEDLALMPFFRTADRALWPRAMVIEDGSAQHWREDVLGFLRGAGYAEIFRSRLNVALTLRA